MLQNIIVTFICLTCSVSLILILEYVLQSQYVEEDVRAPLRPPSSHSSPSSAPFGGYILNNERVCAAPGGEEEEEDILAVFIVTCHVDHVERRSAMRRALPQDELAKYRVRRVFLLALPAAHDKYAISADALADESRRFGDLVQGNFTEAYRNLTSKHLMGLHWTATYCRHAKLLVKMDDDIIINFYEIVGGVLNGYVAAGHLGTFIAGYVLREMVPVRTRANKWYVTAGEYPHATYPPFVSGWFYVTTPHVAAALLTQLQLFGRPYFWIDDVFVTGMLAGAVPSLQLRDICAMFTVHPEFLECCMRDVHAHRYRCQVAVGPNGGDVGLFVRFNEIMRECSVGAARDPRCIVPPPTHLERTCVAERKGHALERGDAIVSNYKLFR